MVVKTGQNSPITSEANIDKDNEDDNVKVGKKPSCWTSPSKDQHHGAPGESQELRSSHHSRLALDNFRETSGD